MVGAPPRLGDQRHVAGVERAHGRHQARSVPPSARKRRDRLAAARHVTDDLHGLLASDRGW